MSNFLPNLHTALKKANLSDLERLNHLFEKSHLWAWYELEHLKVLLYLNQEGDGTYDVHSISEAVAIPGHNGEPWPGPVMIEKILRNLEEVGLLRVTWALRGIKANQSFTVSCDKMYRDWGMIDDFWTGLNGAVQKATYRDLQALQRVYRETNLCDQPDFYIRVLAWCGAKGTKTVSFENLHEEFADIYQTVRFAHDARNPENAISWFAAKGLLGVTFDLPGEPFRLDIGPLQKIGFTTGGAR